MLVVRQNVVLKPDKRVETDNSTQSLAEVKKLRMKQL